MIVWVVKKFALQLPFVFHLAVVGFKAQLVSTRLYCRILPTNSKRRQNWSILIGSVTSPTGNTIAEYKFQLVVNQLLRSPHSLNTHLLGYS